MKRFLAFVYAYIITTLIFAPFSFSASTGKQIDFLLSQVRTNAAGSLAGGHVHFYAVGGTTNKAVYTSIDKSVAAANPYTLDANGTAYLFGDGTYRIVIHTSAGALAYDRDNIRIEDFLGGFTGNGTGNISGFDNLTLTGRMTSATSTVTTATTTTDNITTANITTLNVTGTPTFVDNTINGVDLIDNTIALGKIAHTGTASASVFLRGDGAWASASSAVTTITSYANLKITTPADNQSVTITADKVVAVNSTDVPRILSTVSLTVALDNTGTNGLDNGSLAANTGYFLYVIDNGATTAGLASASATDPVMPSGYTYKALVGWATTDNTTTPFNIEEFTQIDDVYRWATKPLVLNDGGSVTTTALDLSTGGTLGYAVVPPTITKGVFGTIRSNNISSQGNHIFLSSATFSNSISVDNGALVDFHAYAWGGTAGTAGLGFTLPVLLTDQTFYYQADTVTMDIWISGFTLKR